MATIAATLRATVLWGLVAALGVAAYFITIEQVRAIFVLASLSLAMLAFASTVMSVWHKVRLARRLPGLRAMARHDPSPMLVCDTSGAILMANPAAEKIGSAGDLLLADVLSHHVPEPGLWARQMGAQALAQGSAERRIEGALEDLTLTAMRYDATTLIWRLLPTGAQPNAVSRKPDVALVPEEKQPSDLPAAQVDTRDRDEFDALPVPILRIDKEGVITCASHRARQLIKDENVVGRNLAQVVEGLGRPIREWLGDALEGRGLLRPEVARTSTGARDLYLQITLDRIEVDSETHLIAVLHDATELKTLEAQFVQSQKMQAIGQLAGGVAHDFNNLLTAISGHCDLLLLRRDEADPDFADLEQINQNANRAASLVGQLLAFSRKQNLRPEFLDLRHTLADLTHLLNRLVGERVHLSFTHDPALQLIRADKRQLEQVIMNLVVNARDAMPEGGEISIITEVERLTAPFKRDRVELPAGAYVKVRVDDCGAGIAPDQLHKIFEPFFTTKKTGEGTGLGLSTAYGIVKQTGGFIFADSEVGEGSSFSLYFPAHAPETTTRTVRAAKSAPEASQVGAGVVLLVEDEPPVRAFASRALRLRGYTVLEAENGEDALDILSDPALDIDIFVTDVIMPGLDGPGWVRKALQDRPDTHVVFVSGYAEENLAEAQSLIPNSVFLPKPFSLTQLTGVVQAQLSSLNARSDDESENVSR